MMLGEPVPLVGQKLIEFSSLLRGHGFQVAPDQTVSFLEAIELLGPSGIADIRRAALAMLAPPIDRRSEFDTLFNSHFHGMTVFSDVDLDAIQETVVQDDRASFDNQFEIADENETGGDASTTEGLFVRSFSHLNESAAIRQFEKSAARHLPKRMSRRTGYSHSGSLWSLQRALKNAVKNDGELLVIPKLQRKKVLRPIVVLIDISGSMKEQTDSVLKLAYALVQAVTKSFGRVEVFTFGTRLTRITTPLKHKNREAALSAAAALVADWDGGTRIGDALQTFLLIPRFVGFVRGASVVVVSDGLERGEELTMVNAVKRLSRMAWRLDWLTPLAADKEFTPQTAAIRGIVPHITSLGDGSRIQSICSHLLHMSQGEYLSQRKSFQ